MAVGGIYDSFQNSYGVQKIQTIYADEPAKINGQSDVSEPEADLSLQNDELTAAVETEQISHTSRMADLDNTSLKFNKEEPFDYIGMDSSLNDLDMQKAISDMRKDQVLQSYQYFVGSVNDLLGGQPAEDGIVVLKS